ncbi:peptidase inhibitor family I36 protein [Streptomyces luteolus]|uniref:Peptidase inhibitor family I36 protein n=1 Tax=Streptomyces luteolus TaxID=3043615 RepID=A0ABT6T739_9ACTN|nr:peptidase inhibitor family I36 protein [Streptomyces sp. B-S-A12]MDI3423485.1 peptidase inhibitor family I36 protein [Streptomyces sp. B-S-A12]
MTENATADTANETRTGNPANERRTSNTANESRTSNTANESRTSNTANESRTCGNGRGARRGPRKGVAVLCAGLALAAVTGSGAAAATDSGLQGRIDRYLSTMDVPARQVGHDTIRTADGSATVTFAAPGAARDSSCKSGRLCLWAGDNYDHAKLTFYTCAFRKLSKYGFHNRLTSFKNNQTGGTRAKFYEWRGHWALVFGSTAPHNVPDLQGTAYNNTVDAVRVC